MRIFSLNIFFAFLLVSGCSSNDGSDDQQETTESIEDSIVFIGEAVIPDFSAENITKDPLIDDFEFIGEVQSSYWWEDGNGSNYLINTIARSEVDGLPAANLYSYHYSQDKDGEIELIRLVQDYEDVCDFDITLEFLGEPTITDLNGDNFAEVSVIYRKSCRSDVSECDMKLIMHDQNGKYGLRGSQYIVFPDSPEPENYEFDLSKSETSEEIPEWLDFRGRYKNADDFDSCIPEFLELADSVWRSNAFERFD